MSPCHNKTLVRSLAVASLVAALVVAAVLIVGRGPRHATSDGVLNVNNVLWKHQEGHLCLRRSSFQSVTISEEEPEVIVMQEIIDGNMYTYEMINTAFLLEQDSSERSDHKWIDILEGVKYNCQVEPLDDDFDASDAVLLNKEKDGSTSWGVAHWIVSAKPDLTPRILHYPDEDSQDGIDTSQQMEILQVDQCEDVIFEGCDPVAEAGDDHVPSMEVTPEMVEDALIATGHDDGNGTRRDLLYRQLIGIEDFVPSVTRTFWCGIGTDKLNTPCPGDASKSEYDLKADIACRRHDHQKKFKFIQGGAFTRNECINDRDLIFASDNWVLEATFGYAGLSQTWGCHAYGPYYCWKNWRYGKYCCGARIRYGPGRYNSIARYDKWGYYAPQKLCDTDLWECDNGVCSVKSPKAPETTSQCA